MTAEEGPVRLTSEFSLVPMHARPPADIFLVKVNDKGEGDRRSRLKKTPGLTYVNLM